MIHFRSNRFEHQVALGAQQYFGATNIKRSVEPIISVAPQTKCSGNLGRSSIGDGLQGIGRFFTPIGRRTGTTTPPAAQHDALNILPYYYTTATTALYINKYINIIIIIRVSADCSIRIAFFFAVFPPSCLEYANHFFLLNHLFFSSYGSNQQTKFLILSTFLINFLYTYLLVLLQRKSKSLVHVCKL